VEHPTVDEPLVQCCASPHPCSAAANRKHPGILPRSRSLRTPGPSRPSPSLFSVIGGASGQGPPSPQEVEVGDRRAHGTEMDEQPEVLGRIAASAPRSATGCGRSCPRPLDGHLPLFGDNRLLKVVG